MCDSDSSRLVYIEFIIIYRIQEWLFHQPFRRRNFLISIEVMMSKDRRGGHGITRRRRVPGITTTTTATTTEQTGRNRSHKQQTFINRSLRILP